MKSESPKKDQDKVSVNQEQLIYERVFDAILEQKLSPGMRLTEEPLGEIFGVSRTVIRRALLRLSHEGIVEIKPNKGASVVSTPIEQVEDYFEARKVIECAIIRHAVGNATQYQLNALHALIGEEKRYFESGTRGKGLRTSSEFHLQIAEIGSNAPLADFARQLISRTALIVSQYQITSKSPCAYCDHSALIQVIDTGTHEDAERLMSEHLDHIYETLALKKPDEEPDLFQVFSDIDKD